ncbi:uncharacterized protein TNCV_1566981 [Trichonephila clavipes]|nr:uncharacterized protein TNCV_1566981 [Trichonephila clavipes]
MCTLLFEQKRKWKDNPKKPILSLPHLQCVRERVFSFHDVSERLGQNVSTVHHLWERWSRDGTASKNRIPGGYVAVLRGKIAAFSVLLWRIVLRLRQKFELQLVPQRHTELLEISYFKASFEPGPPVACILLTPSHCHLRRQW